MNSLTQLVDAWRLWFQGGAPVELWGVPMLWWSRVGLVLQFSGAVTVVLELVGPERLRIFGESLGGAIPSVHRSFARARAARIEGRRAAARHKALLKQDARDGRVDRTDTMYEGQRRLDRKAPFERYHRWVVSAATLGFATAMWVLWWPGAIATPVVWLVLFLSTPFENVTLGLLSGLYWVSHSIHRLLFAPIAWVLERPSLDKLIKLAAVVLVAVGFHFDLLSN